MKALSFAPKAVSHSYILGGYEGLKLFRLYLIEVLPYSCTEEFKAHIELAIHPKQEHLAEQ